MVRAFDLPKSSSFNFRKMFEISGRHSRSSSALVEPPPVQAAGAGGSPRFERQGPPGGGGTPKRMEVIIRKVGSPRTPDKRYPVPVLSKDGGGGGGGAAAAAGCSFKPPSDMEMMKEKFAKLLLGEDMSGGGRGVSSAMALSDAITNIAASIFGEQRKLEPMPPERRARWKKETDWLLSVVDHIVELVPSQQSSPDGSTMEVMVTRQRTDLLVNIPALRKLDAMLMECLDNFKGQNEFWYPNTTTIDGVGDESVKADSNHQRDWWIPTVKVPPEGLSEVTRKWLQYQKDSVNQVLKAAMAINAHILSEMEIPETYIDSLPKNGRASLGDSIYKSITDDFFDPDQFLSSMDLTSDHNVLDLKNRIEASIVIWKRKMNHKDHGKLSSSSSSWGSAVSLDKRELFEDRAETLLLLLKHRFPGIPQSSLDISKIEFNKDVGHAVLESYSRVLESLASAVMCRIDDVLYADTRARSCRSAESDDGKQSTPSSLYHEDEKVGSEDPPGSTTLMDFIGWKAADQEGGARSSNSSTDDHDDDDHCFKEETVKVVIVKTPDHPSKKVSYLERLENWGGLRSPTSRH